jgi:hypothetical protein
VLAWTFFGLVLALVSVWAIRVHLASPAPPPVAGEPDSRGVWLGKTEAERRTIFQELARGEPGDRVAARRERENAVWDRNHDSYFHELEFRRFAGVSRRLRIPEWQAHLIFDEGLRAHWPPPPGVEIRADDAPLAQKTRPFAERPLITAGPPAPAGPPAAPPGPSAAPAAPPGPSAAPAPPTAGGPVLRRAPLVPGPRMRAPKLAPVPR